MTTGFDQAKRHLTSAGFLRLSVRLGRFCCSGGIAAHVQVCGDEPDIFADPVVVRDWIG
ncbi:hypothetical protein [Saccharopolyspora pogona]|uniref:hypothetical protein n=1 Tax=Saccharopolyspora pogona TaxID=333966 RepID=UPI001682B326|nr:hypothetical protein [Saccharopolyspora pogona]